MRATITPMDSDESVVSSTGWPMPSTPVVINSKGRATFNEVQRQFTKDKPYFFVRGVFTAYFSPQEVLEFQDFDDVEFYQAIMVKFNKQKYRSNTFDVYESEEASPDINLPSLVNSEKVGIAFISASHIPCDTFGEPRPWRSPIKEAKRAMLKWGDRHSVMPAFYLLGLFSEHCLYVQVGEQLFSRSDPNIRTELYTQANAIIDASDNYVGL